tara:strand:+ start:321 stop:488 length:168 start_codon:yes stop_codon:yes gene_type:complete
MLRELILEIALKRDQISLKMTWRLDRKISKRRRRGGCPASQKQPPLRRVRMRREL